jgi:O-antigen ligase
MVPSTARTRPLTLALPTAIAPGGRVGVALALVVGVALAVVVAATPWIAAIAVAVGLPFAALSLFQPRAAVLLLAFSIPFSGWTKLPLGRFDVNATDLLVAALLLGWIGRGVLQRQLVVRAGPIFAAGTLLFLAALLSTLSADDFPSALKELIKWAEMLGVMLFVSSTATEESDQRFLLYALLAAASVESMVGLFQFLAKRGPDFFAIGPFLRAYGDFGQPNALAGYLSMLFPFALALALLGGRRQPWLWLATGLIGAAILATFSRGAWLGIIIGLAIAAVIWDARTRRALAGGVVVIAMVGALAAAGALPSDASDHLAVVFENFVVFDVRNVEVTPKNWSLVERMAHWQAGWAMAMDHPITGVGPANFEDAYTDYYLQDWLEPLGHAHNYYINTFAELGIIGLSVYLLFLVVVFHRIAVGLRRAGRQATLRRAILVAALAAFTTFCIHNSFDNMYIHGLGVQLGLILGLVEVAARSQPGDDLDGATFAHRS